MSDNEDIVYYDENENFMSSYYETLDLFETVTFISNMKKLNCSSDDEACDLFFKLYGWTDEDLELAKSLSKE